MFSRFCARSLERNSSDYTRSSSYCQQLFLSFLNFFEAVFSTGPEVRTLGCLAQPRRYYTRLSHSCQHLFSSFSNFFSRSSDSRISSFFNASARWSIAPGVRPARTTDTSPEHIIFHKERPARLHGQVLWCCVQRIRNALIRLYSLSFLSISRKYL